MLNYSSHLAVAKKLLSAYSGDVPFPLYLKSYFNQYKKHGSRDRKLISALCYDYFRLGFAAKNLSTEEKILTGFFLCEQAPSHFLASLQPSWNKSITTSISEKLELAGLSRQEAENIFPYTDELSDDIHAEKFTYSFLTQPKLYLRIRPGLAKIVLQKLQANDIKYERVYENCIALPNSSKINTIIDLDREAVVQDYSSQRVADLLEPAISPANNADKPAPNVWDCCAASGGKSIMAYDINPAIHLTASDKRQSILKNLTMRFAIAGIKNYEAFVADLSTGLIDSGQESFLTDKKYDVIIADVPCTGSGTWARNPEQLYYFDKKQLKKYSELQKQIVENAINRLKPGGYLLYVTCSVFKKENEEAVDFIATKLKMDKVKMKLLKGYEILADTMFAALFRLPG